RGHVRDTHRAASRADPRNNYRAKWIVIVAYRTNAACVTCVRSGSCADGLRSPKLGQGGHWGGNTPVLRYQDIPYQFNVTSYFIDRNLAEGRGARPALIADGRAVSYAQLARTSNQIGNVLHELGVRRGQRVLLVCGDGLEFVAAWYAVQKIG